MKFGIDPVASIQCFIDFAMGTLQNWTHRKTISYKEKFLPKYVFAFFLTVFDHFLDLSFVLVFLLLVCMFSIVCIGFCK